MKRQKPTLFIALILASALALALTGCNIAPGAEAEPAESVEPLDAAAWPTPQPDAPQASPTPFPKITIVPTATPTPRPVPTDEAASAPISVGATQGDLTFTGDIRELVEQVTSLSGGFPPTAAAVVTAESAVVHHGPADSFDSVGTATGGELAAVLGTNAEGNWWYVLTRAGLQGWLPADEVQVTFSLEEAPVLPDDPMAQSPGSTAAAASPLAGLEPVAVAVVTTKGSTSVRQGPASTYPVSGSVEQGELAGVFGINAAGDWLYVFTISGANGWLPEDTLRVTGSLAEAPVLSADSLAASATASQPGSATASTASIQPLDLEELVAVATARVDNDALNVRQGPGAAYEGLGTLSRDDEVAVLAVNKTEEWALVKTTDGEYGWTSLDYLAVDGSLADAPQVISPAPNRVLPTGQVAPIFAPSAVESNADAIIDSSGNPRSDSNPGQKIQASESSTTSTVPTLTWTSMATARAKQPDVKLYRGPATSYEPIVSLAKDETSSVLGLNPSRDWALVKPSDDYKSPGWGPVEDLNMDGSLANAPQITTAWVDSNELAVLRGPGLFYEQTGKLAINTLVAVLGVDEGRSWALIQPVMSGGQGWIPLNFLTLSGSWSDVPIAPSPSLAGAEASETNETATSFSTSTAGPGKVVLQTSSGGAIMVINPDGTGLRRLTHGIDPALSPDGNTVAFTRWTGDDGTLWLIDVDGSNERPLLGETKQAKHAAWSPDGQRIVVNFQHEGRLDPKQACQNLIELGDRQPDIPWNVDLDSITVKFTDNVPYLCWTLPPDPHWGLRIVDTASGEYEDVPSDTYAFGPEWDPANPWRVVSSGHNGLVQLDVNRSEQWALSDRGEDHTPVFSPHGRYIALAFNNNGHYDIHRMNSDGSGRVILTKTPLWVTAQPGANKPWNNVSPAWSPDGSQIAFLTDRSGRWEIWVMGADGSNQRPMFTDEVNDQLQFTYDFVDERVLSWR
jgi:uncharacterized protein YgiM (DUF1202 family)